jgi:AraC-like DNA-binding protein
VQRSKTPPQRRLPTWLAQNQGLLDVIDILRWHARINCTLVAHLPASRWAVLHAESEPAHEIASALNPTLSNAYTGENVRAVVASHRSRLSRRGHLYDLTVPVLRGKKLESIICAGAFLRRPFTPDALIEQWQVLSGSAPSEFDPLFRRFVRLALQLPVLDADDLRSFRELLEILAQLMTGRGDPARHERRIAALRVGVFSRWLTSLESSVKRFTDPVHNRAWSEGLLFSYEKEELGMEHMPNIVVAVTTSERGRHVTHALAELANGRELQRRAMHFARTLPETLAAPLDDYGVVFLSHVAERRTKAARRARIAGLVEKMAAFVRRETKGRAIAGVGRLDGRGSDLPEMAREALIAMQLAAHRELPLLFHDEIKGAKRSDRSALVGVRLVRLFEQEQFTELNVALSDWIQSVVEESAEHAGIVRTQVEWLLAALTEIAARHAGLEPRAAADLEDRMYEALSLAVDVRTLLEALRSGIASLMSVIQAPPAGRSDFKLDRAARYIAQACTGPLSLEQVARRVGISRNYFSELFKKTYGKGFSAFLFEQRLAKAKALLKTTEHPVNQIAALAGFVNVSSFHRAFRQAVGATPSQFRVRGKEWRSTP